MSFFPAVQSFVARLGNDILGTGRPTSPALGSSSEKTGTSSAAGSDGHTLEPAPFEPCPLDVVVLKMMLHEGLHLPVEVVLSILDFAEYWPHTTAIFDSPFVTRSGAATENAFVLRTKPLGLIKKTHYDERYYATTCAQPLPLAEDAEYPLEQFQQWIGGPTDIVQRPCRKIVFTITSHDQGWSHNARTDRGTYRGSYTWFEAGLERFDKTASRPKDNNSEKEANTAPPSNDDVTVEKNEGPSHASDREVELDSSSAESVASSSHTTKSDTELPDPYLPVYSLRPVYPTLDENPNPPRYHHTLLADPQHTIQYNKTATREPITHKVVWSWTDNINRATGEELTKLGRGEETGTGSFVRDMKPGDVVSVWAKSRFGGWANHVDAVKVDVYWAL